MIKGITMQPQLLRLTIQLNRKQNKVNDSTAPNQLIRMEGEPNIPNSSTLGGSLETTLQDPFSSSDGEEIHNVGEGENQAEDAKNQLVLYDPAVANSACGVEAVPDSIAHQPPSFSRFPFSNQPSRVLPAVGAFTVQCANCLKWRVIPSKAKYEEIREHITEQPFSCETAREWRSDLSCHDPTDLMQDESRLWAIDKPNISQPPRGWERLLRIRGEGSTKFADVYYVAPTGKRLRSMVEIQKYLDKHPECIEEGITISQFSFQVPKPLQENYVRKRRSHFAPSYDAIDHGMPALDPSKALMAHNRRSPNGPFPVPRLTTPSDGNYNSLRRLQADPFARNRHVRWSDEMDGFLITSLVEQVLAGHKRSDNGFTSFQVAKAMERVLNGCGVTVSNKNVRARLKTLKKEHAEVRQLLNMSGFGFDPETGRIVADAVAWDEFIKGKPKFGKWRNQLCPRYDEMETIFGNDAATGERSVSSFDHFSPINATDESVNEVDMENVEMDNRPVIARKRTVEEGTNKAKRRRAQPVDESTIALLRIAESSSKIAQAMEMQAMLDTQNHVNWQLILEKLEAMNLDMKDIMEAMKAFRSDDGLAKVFLNLTSEKYMRALVFDKLGRDPPPLL